MTQAHPLVSIRLASIRPDSPLLFDVFIQVGDRHIHYIRKDDPLEGTRIQTLKSKGVKKLFIQEHDEPQYLVYLDNGLNELKNSSESVDTKASVAEEMLDRTAATAANDAKTQDGYNRLEDRVGKLVEFFSAEQDALKKLLTDRPISGEVAAHCSTVAGLSVSLAQKLGISDQRELLDLSVAALIHDAGKEGLAPTAQVRGPQLKGEDLEAYQSHCKRGAEMFADKSYINPKILELVLNHEEVGDGAGFPDKKILSKMPLSQQVLNLCNDYDRTCTELGLTPAQAIQKYFVDKMGLFELPHIKALQSVLKG